MGRKLRRARKTYNWTWKRVAKEFGQEGAPPPRVEFLGKKTPKPNPDASMWVGDSDDPTKFDSSKPKTVFITPGQRRVLGRPKGGYTGGRRAAQKRLVHEWRHYNQPPELLNNPDPSLRERDASLFARRVAKKYLRPKK